MRLVLDHSALIPCGDKPLEEKESIRILGDKLVEMDATCFSSCRYLMVFKSKCKPILKRHIPLPVLQRILYNTIDIQYRRCQNIKGLWCGKGVRIKRGSLFKIHYVGRNAYEMLRKSKDRNMVKIISYIDKNFKEEDKEVVSILIYVTMHSKDRNPIFLITSDNLLKNNVLTLVNNMIKVRTNIVVNTPKEFLEFLR